VAQSNDLNGIQRMPSGIQGFDDITGGGFPRDYTSLIVGPAGSGKTVLGLQTLVNGARLYGETGIFVAFEEKTKRIKANAASFGWDLDALEKDKLFFLDARMTADVVTTGEFDLTGLLASLKAKADEMGARRIVFDAIDVLLTLMDNPTMERRELYRLHDWLDDSGLTGILTSRVNPDIATPLEQYSFLQYMSDCVLNLTHHVVDRISLRGLRVIKYRGANFIENQIPMVITRSGIELFNPGAPNLDYPVSTERIPTGIDQLDSMLNGGYLRGSSTLISGAPGTAKTTLAGAFVEAACKRGEKSLYISFDEGTHEIVRNLSSVGIHLGRHIETGSLIIHALLASTTSSIEHMLAIQSLIKEHRPRCIVIDPLSALIHTGGPHIALAVAQQLIFMAKAEGITSLQTSLIDSDDPENESSALRISTISDNWLHLSYIIRAGERNRALTIVKSRGTHHSNQVRELVLSEDGVSLTSVYAAEGEVLMGTLRYEKEIQARRARERSEIELEGKRRDLEKKEAALAFQIRGLIQEQEVINKEIKTLQEGQLEQTRREQNHETDILRLRGGDEQKK
jgi:circadian clock protein KaiC